MCSVGAVELPLGFRTQGRVGAISRSVRLHAATEHCRWSAQCSRDRCPSRLATQIIFCAQDASTSAYGDILYFFSVVKSCSYICRQVLQGFSLRRISTWKKKHPKSLLNRRCPNSEILRCAQSISPRYREFRRLTLKAEKRIVRRCPPSPFVSARASDILPAARVRRLSRPMGIIPRARQQSVLRNRIK